MDVSLNHHIRPAARNGLDREFRNGAYFDRCGAAWVVTATLSGGGGHRLSSQHGFCCDGRISRASDRCQSVSQCCCNDLLSFLL